jgi:tRNA nucleotidyltransferase (CCA-adding enzyme)
MKIYLVGGAVRDNLLGFPIKERDWVVVGATVNDMLNLGYRQVGKEFPVFLHPKTSEEYALARVERKVNLGYKGFTFDASPRVTLEEDLMRRDLTINAMAETPEGELVDPYHGRQDLEKKVLRHVSPAFAEDPVRILRVGRFLARYAHLGFHVAPETYTLMHDMVKAGEVNALVAERVWKEWERALGEKNPEQFFAVLAECGALPILFPKLEMTNPGINAMILATKLSTQPAIRFAALLHALPDAAHSIAALCHRYRVPNAYRELALLTAKHHEAALQARNASAQTLLSLFTALDIFRREQRFKAFVIACLAIAQSRQQDFDAAWLMAGADVAKSVDVSALMAEGFKDNALAIQLKIKREEKIAAWLAHQEK